MSAKPRPILFSAPMVLALLSGEKTQTRRVVKPPLDFLLAGGASLDQLARVPFARFGRLYVRETWRTYERESDGLDGIRYRADDAFIPIDNTHAASSLWIEAHDNGKHGDAWRPSIFLPRWASRITLEILIVRAERLQDISEADAKAEGVTTDPQDGTINGKPARLYPMTHRQAFIWLWEAISGKRLGCAWRENPWVWVVEFKRVERVT